eukprot:569562-Amphidinium_carterae.1
MSHSLNSRICRINGVKHKSHPELPFSPCDKGLQAGEHHIQGGPEKGLVQEMRFVGATRVGAVARLCSMIAHAYVTFWAGGEMAYDTLFGGRIKVLERPWLSDMLEVLLEQPGEQTSNIFTVDDDEFRLLSVGTSMESWRQTALAETKLTFEFVRDELQGAGE